MRKLLTVGSKRQASNQNRESGPQISEAWSDPLAAILSAEVFRIVFI